MGFPAFDETTYKVVHVSLTQSCNGLPYDFMVYERLDADGSMATCLNGPSPALTAAGGAGQFLHEEYHYLNAIREIIDKGVLMEDRTGVGTRSIFGMQMRF